MVLHCNGAILWCTLAFCQASLPSPSQKSFDYGKCKICEQKFHLSCYKKTYGEKTWKHKQIGVCDPDPTGCCSYCLAYVSYVLPVSCLSPLCIPFLPQEHGCVQCVSWCVNLAGALVPTFLEYVMQERVKAKKRPRVSDIVDVESPKRKTFRRSERYQKGYRGAKKEESNVTWSDVTAARMQADKTQKEAQKTADDLAGDIDEVRRELGVAREAMRQLDRKRAALLATKRVATAAATRAKIKAMDVEDSWNRAHPVLGSAVPVVDIDGDDSWRMHSDSDSGGSEVKDGEDGDEEDDSGGSEVKDGEDGDEEDDSGGSEVKDGEDGDEDDSGGSEVKDGEDGDEDDSGASEVKDGEDGDEDDSGGSEVKDGEDGDEDDSGASEDEEGNQKKIESLKRKLELARLQTVAKVCVRWGRRRRHRFSCFRR
jgi:hypothetical protein